MYVYLLSVRTQLLEGHTFSCPLLLHVSAVFGHHRVVFTITFMEKNTDLRLIILLHACYCKNYLTMAKNGRNML
jgi:hypothetical protein